MMKSSFYFIMLLNQLFLNFCTGHIHLSILKKFPDNEFTTEFRFSQNNIYSFADMHFELQMKLDALKDSPLMQLRHYTFYWKVIAIHVETHEHLFTNLNQSWLSTNWLQEFADAIHHKGAPLGNCWGFIDITIRPICQPGQK